MMKFNQLCVWQGTLLGESTVEDFEEFFLKEGFLVHFAEIVLTNPDRADSGDIIPETGGRSDILFYIADEDISKFSIARLSYGIRWWEDVVFYNNESHLYPQEILNKYPVKW